MLLKYLENNFKSRVIFDEMIQWPPTIMKYFLKLNKHYTIQFAITKLYNYIQNYT